MGLLARCFPLWRGWGGAFGFPVSLRRVAGGGPGEDAKHQEGCGEDDVAAMARDGRHRGAQDICRSRQGGSFIPSHNEPANAA